MAGRHSLAYQNAWRLSVIFVLFELLATAAVVFLLMMPMANRAAPTGPTLSTTSTGSTANATGPRYSTWWETTIVDVPSRCAFGPDSNQSTRASCR